MKFISLIDKSTGGVTNLLQNINLVAEELFQITKIEALSLVFEQISTRLNFSDHTELYLYDDDLKQFILHYTSYHQNQERKEDQYLILEESILSSVYKKKQVRHFFDLDTKTSLSLSSNSNASPSKSAIFLPIIANDHCYGVWSLLSNKPNFFHDQNIEYAKCIAHLMGLSISKIKAEEKAKLIEKQLDIAKKQKKLILKNELDAIVVFNEDGLIFNWNQQAENIFGYTSKEVINKNIYELIIPVDQHDFCKKRLQVQVQDQDFNNNRIEIEMLNHKGRLGRVNVAATILAKEGLYIWVIRDGSQNVDIQEYMQEQKDFYEGIINELPADIAVFDPEIRFLYVNPQAVKDSKMRKWLIGKTHKDYCLYRGLPISIGELREAKIKEAIQKREIISFEEIKKSPEGSIVEAYKRMTHPVFNEKGELIYIIGYGINIIELKNTELQLAEINKNLEGTVEERTRKLKAANDNLQSFAYSISHDLRAPLRHIIAFGTYLEKGSREILDEKNKRFLENIIMAANKMQKLIDGLLHFSRLGNVLLNFKKVAPIPMLESIFDQILHSSQYKDHKITYEIKIIHEIYADEVLIEQVFANLISNAVKYSSTQEMIEVAITSEVRNNDILFSVKDNGVGFNMKYKDKLFGTFQRLHSASEFEGTGIGLANVKRIVERHGGEIWAESEVNLGSTFYFTIPKK